MEKQFELKLKEYGNKYLIEIKLQGLEAANILQTEERDTIHISTSPLLHFTKEQVIKNPLLSIIFKNRYTASICLNKLDRTKKRNLYDFYKEVLDLKASKGAVYPKDLIYKRDKLKFYLEKINEAILSVNVEVSAENDESRVETGGTKYIVTHNYIQEYLVYELIKKMGFAEIKLNSETSQIHLTSCGDVKCIIREELRKCLLEDDVTIVDSSITYRSFLYDFNGHQYVKFYIEDDIAKIKFSGGCLYTGEEGINEFLEKVKVKYKDNNTIVYETYILEAHRLMENAGFMLQEDLEEKFKDIKELINSKAKEEILQKIPEYSTEDFIAKNKLFFDILYEEITDFNNLQYLYSEEDDDNDEEEDYYFDLIVVPMKFLDNIYNLAIPAPIFANLYNISRKDLYELFKSRDNDLKEITEVEFI